MAEFRLGRIKFVWQGDWTTGQSYVVDDVVNNGGKSYICVINHTASAAFSTDSTAIPPKWNLVADGLSWQGDWQTATLYNVGDQVKYGGTVYICNTAHTSQTYLEDDQAKWDLLATSFDWQGEWDYDTRYKVNDFVSYGGHTYFCNTAHSSPSATADLVVTNAVANGLEATLTFASQIIPPFEVGSSIDITGCDPSSLDASGAVVTACTTTTVTYANATDTAVTPYVSGGTIEGTNLVGLEADSAKWTSFNDGLEYVGVYAAGTRYKVNDIVKFGASTWICTAPHMAEADFDETKFSIFVEGLQFEDSWSAGADYQVGDVVTYGGYSYIALRNNSGSNPSTGVDAALDWELYTTGFNFTGEWVSSTAYKVGDVVSLGGYTYLCTADNTGTTPPNASYWDRLNTGVKWTNILESYTAVSGTSTVGIGSTATFDVTRNGTAYSVTINNVGINYAVNDRIVISGNDIGGLSPVNDLVLNVDGVTAGEIDTISQVSGYAVTWTDGASYVLGDIVFFGASSYICILEHIANAATNRPDVDTSATYWNLFAAGSESSVLTVEGDTYYYGLTGPTRLPIGQDGQLLRVSGGYPTWAYYGVVNNLVYVSTTGVNDLSDGRGTSVDKPWNSVRFACEQIEKGFYNKSAQHLLAKNKQFIMKEVSNWVTYTYTVNISETVASTGEFVCDSTANLSQNMPIEFSGTLGGVTVGTKYYVKTIVDDTNFTISEEPGGTVFVLTNATGSMTGTLSYDYGLCQRDVGILVEALMYDLGHKGNEHSTNAAKAYYTAAGSAYINSNFGEQPSQTIAAYDYMKTLVENILTNVPPAKVYQEENGVAVDQRIAQTIDTSLEVETDTVLEAHSLLTIITDGLAAGRASAIPAAIFANTTISVKTGTYYEVLPIVLPKNTAVVGDELRSTVISPQPAIAALSTDKEKTTSALNRIASIVPNIVSNNELIVTTRNTATQDFYYNGYESILTTSVEANVGYITDILANASTPSVTLRPRTDIEPDYFNAARLIKANKEFLKSEVEAYMVANETALWASLGTAGQAACKRDIGYIVDALEYDLTYGGNLATQIAARSYYSNGVFVEPSNELAAAKAVQLYLKSIITYIAEGDNSSWTKLTTAVQDVSGTPGSAAAGEDAEDRIQEIHDTMDTGDEPTTIAPDTTWCDAYVAAAVSTVQAAKTAIRTSAINWIVTNYPDLEFNQTLCSRDIGYVIDALCYDALFNTSYLSVQSGLSYQRGLASTGIVLTSQLEESIGTMNFVKNEVQRITSGTAVLNRNINTITEIVGKGLGYIPSYTMPDPVGYDVGYFHARRLLLANKEFLVAEVTAWIAAQVAGGSGIWSGFTYDVDSCERDVRYIVDGFAYDLTYGGNLATQIAARSYYSFGSAVNGAEEDQSKATWLYVKTIIGYIVTGDDSSWTKTPANAEIQDVSGTAGSAGAATFVENRVQEIHDTIDTGVEPTTIAPSTAWVSSALTTINASVQAEKAHIQEAAISWVNTVFPTLVYNDVTCARDVGYIVDALCYDLMFGSNFLSSWNGMSYRRGITSTDVVLNDQLTQTLGLIGYVGASVKELAFDQTGLVGNNIALTRVNTSANAIYDILNNGLTGEPALIMPVPDNADSDYTNAVAKIADNYAFIKADVENFINNNHNAVWTGLTATQQAACTRDVEYILDAVRYDVTYGGNTQSYIAGDAYYTGINLVFSQDEYDIVTSAYGHLKSIVETIALNDPVTPQAGNGVSQDQTGTGDTTGDAAAFAAARVQDVIDWIIDGPSSPPATIAPDTSWVHWALVSGFNDLQARKTEIQNDGLGHNRKFFQSLSYDEDLCSRDIGLMVDAIGYDMMFGSNFAGIVAGRAYYRGLESTGIVLASQKEASLSLVNFLKYKIKGYATGGAIGKATAIINDVTATINGGANTRILWPIASTSDSNDHAAAKLIFDNKEFIAAEVLAYVEANFPAIYYSKEICARDVGYIVDAVRYDMTYGGNWATIKAGVAYYSRLTDELQIDSNDLLATIGALGRLQQIAEAIADGSSYTELQTKVSRVYGTAGDGDSATLAGSLILKMTDVVEDGIDTDHPQITITGISGGNVITYTNDVAGIRNIAVGDQIIPRTSSNGLVEGTVYFVKTTPSGSSFTLAPSWNGNEITSLTDGSGLSIVSEFYNMPTVSGASTTLRAQAASLSNERTTLKDSVIAYIAEKYPNLDYDSDTCSRDVGYVVDAITFDMLTSSNFQTVKSGLAYHQAQASLALGELQKRPTVNSFRYLQDLIREIVENEATSLKSAMTNMSTFVRIISEGSGVTPYVVGSNTYLNNVGVANAANALRKNVTFLENEATAWIKYTFGGYVTSTTGSSSLVTLNKPHNLKPGDPIIFEDTSVETTATNVSSTGNLITVLSTEGMIVGQTIVFSGTQIGNLSPNTTYFILTIENDTQLTISDSFGGSAYDPGTGAGIMTVLAGAAIGSITTGVTYYVFTTPDVDTFTFTTSIDGSVQPITDDSGTMIVHYSFDEDSCKRDMREYVESMVYDLTWPGNYKSTRAAVLYNHAVAGSETSDMFQVSNASGLRNCTLRGLSGDLTATNDFGTKRPTAGAFVALNPGFGPFDSNVWVTSRSHYSQNVTMFGEGCTGAKIDAALHQFGNKSMVKNDFTTIISDGIGVWCTGQDSLTELVSVFNYYGYSGYLAELGGRIRATNGNSSYGTFGVIAEGVDVHETPLYGTVDNRFFQAQPTTTVTDGLDEILRLEFSNAGTHYTNVTYTISGSGFNATALGDEFRDGAAFETRIIDLDNDQGVGGSLYETASNAAQGGDLYSITIAATDTALNNAYSGMRIQLTAGTGVGQFANILTYGTGSKIATVTKPHFDAIEVTNTTVTSNRLTVASTASLYVGMPIVFGGTTFGNIVEAVTYFVETIPSATQFTIENSGGTQVSLTTASGSMMAYESGWDHTVSGTVIENNLDLTTQYTIEPAISYTAPGYTSVAETLNSSAAWGNMTFGDGKYLAIANSGTTTTYSADGDTWQSAGALAASASWTDVVYGGGHGATAHAVIGGLGGVGAVFEAVLGVPNTTGAATEEQVASVRIIDGGQGYTTPPVIVFTPTNGGLGATATCAVLDGKIVDVTVTIPGSGYVDAPIVTAATDRVTSVIVDSWGRDFYSTASVTISDPFTGAAWSSGGSVTTDDIIYYVDSGTKNWYLVTTGGTLAGSPPVHTSGSDSNGTATLLYIGTSAQISANMTNYGVSSIDVDETGSGYTTVPIVTIIDTAARYVAIANGSGDNCYTTRGGIATAASWTAGTATGKTDLVALTYGNGVYVAVGGTASAVSSANGNLWTSRTIPSLSAGTYSDVVYGNQTFVAISTGNNVTAVSSNGNAWSAGGNLPASLTWSSVAYGNGRFVAIATGSSRVAYSLNKGTAWLESPSGLPSGANWSKVTYGQGVFIAVATGTNVCATSPDGVTWTARTLSASSNWSDIQFGNINNNPLWIGISSTTGTTATKVYTGARTTGRVTVADEIVTEVRMLEPGSGYAKGTVTATTVTTDVITVDNTINLVENQPVEFFNAHAGADNGGLEIEETYYVLAGSITSNSFKVTATSGGTTAVELTTSAPTDLTYRSAPIFTVTDPNNVNDVALRVRMGDGVLGNPSFTNRGAENATATTEAVGDGYGDLYQPSSFINIAGLYDIPEAGANVEFSSLPGQYFKLVVVTNELGELGDKTAQFQINPALTVLQAPKHGDRVTTRLKYSQVRLTGHDYLYIGTGGKEETNYPNVDISKAITANQAVFSNGGRVFFTSTDQDGNFNVGNLFGVQQATGTATLNASAFNLSGLNSLQLGSVELGIGSAIITQFSTDPFFTADSDNVVPTQRAIKAYITAQIGGGQSSLNVNTLTSGIIYVAGDSISTTTGEGINVTSKMNFTGGISGAPVALGFFMQR